MSSRDGIIAEGTDGSDFGHREKVASHYQISATFKSRLKFTIILHFLLFFVVCFKVSAEVLDLFGLSVQEIKDLEFPKPLLWEWIWLGSLVFAFLGYGGIRKNRVTTMKIYAWGIFIFAVCPVVGAAVYYLEELLRYIQSHSESGSVQMWKGIPVAVVWYGFIGISFQVHMVSIVFSLKLIEAWAPKNLKKLK